MMGGGSYTMRNLVLLVLAASFVTLVASKGAFVVVASFQIIADQHSQLNCLCVAPIIAPFHRAITYALLWQGWLSDVLLPWSG